MVTVFHIELLSLFLVIKVFIDTIVDKDPQFISIFLENINQNNFHANNEPIFNVNMSSVDPKTGDTYSALHDLAGRKECTIELLDQLITKYKFGNL
jgi:hypothetical protein